MTTKKKTKKGKARPVHVIAKSDLDYQALLDPVMQYLQASEFRRAEEAKHLHEHRMGELKMIADHQARQDQALADLIEALRGAA